MSEHYDVIIIGAGAAGLMCAIRAGERGLSVLLLDKAEKIANKIHISGGGRCNFTNLNITPSAYLSPNPHFCKSALSRYTQWHFIELLTKHGLSYHEKTLGQLFCEQKSAAVVDCLYREAMQYAVCLKTALPVQSIHYHTPAEISAKAPDKIPDTPHQDGTYAVHCHHSIDDNASTTSVFMASQLVIATGGPSIPKIGSSDFALRVAKQFGIKNTPFAPALVPLTLSEQWLTRIKPLAGVSHTVRVRVHEATFRENLLFTHRGLSGPAILQISSYWRKGETLHIDLFPDDDALEQLRQAKADKPQQRLSQYLGTRMPNKLAQAVVKWFFDDHALQGYNDKALQTIAEQLHDWQMIPAGNEGMKKAEVSTGGIAPDALSSKTFECRQQNGLYFIGEAIDVTGWLGGYNFQWAWSSGWCCGDSLAIAKST